MFVALAISVLFALSYGIIAARSRNAEKVLIPLLDIFQSVPILGFFPAAVLFFVGLFGEGGPGVEIAAIFLIFTSMAWNLAFAVYEAVSVIPKELDEVSQAFRLRGFLRLRTEIIPICIPKLVYNGIMSWAGGWYFLVASEIISLGSVSHRLPGIGSFIGDAAYAGNIPAALDGLLALVLTILLIDLLLWRPLELYANRFRYEFAGGHQAAPAALPFLHHFLARSTKLAPGRFAHLVHIFFAKMFSAIAHFASAFHRILRPHLPLALSALAVIAIGFALYRLSLGPPTVVALPTVTSDEWALISAIPFGLLSSGARIFVAYGIALAWTLPVGVLIARNERLFQLGMPVFESLASMPATALFPLVFVMLIGLPFGQELATLVLLLTGMQWYLLFNVIGGVRSIPEDFEEAAKAFNLRGTAYWRYVLLPAIFPALITGSITAWGGGWNALIVSEYITFGGKTYATLGIGALLDEATYKLGSVTVMLVVILAMSLTVVIVNRLLWRRMYHKACTKYAFNY